MFTLSVLVKTNLLLLFATTSEIEPFALRWRVKGPSEVSRRGTIGRFAGLKVMLTPRAKPHGATELCFKLESSTLTINHTVVVYIHERFTFIPIHASFSFCLTAKG